MIASNRRGLWKLFSLLLCCIYGVQPIMKSTTKYSLGQQAFSPRGHADHSKQTIKWCIALANTCPTFSLEIYRFKPTPPLKKRRKKNCLWSRDPIKTALRPTSREVLGFHSRQQWIFCEQKVLWTRKEPWSLLRETPDLTPLTSSWNGWRAKAYQPEQPIQGSRALQNRSELLISFIQAEIHRHCLTQSRSGDRENGPLSWRVGQDAAAI